jgi:hypothetical protein
MNRATTTGTRGGTTLLEIVVAIVILGIAGTGIAGMAFHAGKSSMEVRAVSRRDAALASVTEQVGNVAYESLTEYAGCEERGEADFAYLACVRVEQETEHLRVVTVLIEPEDERVAGASNVLLRARTPPASPF